MPQPLVERLDHRRVGALLGPEDIGRAGLAVHGVVYVAHGDDLHAVQRRVAAGHVDALDVLQRAAHGHEALARGVVEPDARGSGRAAAAVVGGAAAQPDDQPPGAGARGVGDQLAHAEGGGAAGILVVAHHRQPGGRGHLQHGGGAAVDQAVIALALLEPGAGDGLGHLVAANGGEEGVHAALAAVGDGDGLHGAAGEYLLDALRYELANAGGRHGALKGIGYKNRFFQCKNLHLLAFTSPSACSQPSFGYENRAGPAGPARRSCRVSY